MKQIESTQAGVAQLIDLLAAQEVRQWVLPGIFDLSPALIHGCVGAGTTTLIVALAMIVASGSDGAMRPRAVIIIADDHKHVHRIVAATEAGRGQGDAIQQANFWYSTGAAPLDSQVAYILENLEKFTARNSATELAPLVVIDADRGSFADRCAAANELKANGVPAWIAAHNHELKERKRAPSGIAQNLSVERHERKITAYLSGRSVAPMAITADLVVGEFEGMNRFGEAETCRQAFAKLGGIHGF